MQDPFEDAWDETKPIKREEFEIVKNGRQYIVKPGKITSKEYDILRLRYIYKLTQKAVSQRIGCTANNIAFIERKALKKLIEDSSQ